MANPPRTPIKPTTKPPFDIVSTYHSVLASDPDLTPPIAAIEAVIQLLTSSTATTISETLDLLSIASTTLRTAIPNWIPATAGTDLFQRYLVQTFNRAAGEPGSNALDDFSYLRHHLLSNGRLFVKRAKEARAKIAIEGGKFVRDDTTILTMGDSRVVAAILLRAAADGIRTNNGGPGFRVIYVESSHPRTSTLPTGLRAHGIPVSVIPFDALLSALPLTTFVLIGAEAVVSNGGIISRLGTHQMALLARGAGKPVYVGVEGYKFVRLFPLASGGGDVPVRQRVVKFVPADGREEGEEWGGGQGSSDGDGDGDGNESRGSRRVANGVENSSSRKETPEITEPSEMIDFTPPELITALITENGVLTPTAVSEELVKLWF